MLVACHAEFPVGKFMGMCNEPKSALDECFRVSLRLPAPHLRFADESATQCGLPLNDFASAMLWLCCFGVCLGTDGETNEKIDEFHQTSGIGEIDAQGH